MADIQCRGGYVAVVDDEDLWLVDKYRWRYRPDREKRAWIATPETRTQDGVRTGRKYRYLCMHRVVMQAAEDQVVHIRDGDGLNCRKSNLVLTTRTCINSERSNGSGIFYDRRWGRFQAYAYLNGVERFAGRHWTYEEAVAARNAAMDDLLREHAEALLLPDRPLDRLRLKKKMGAATA